jgi:hypothetical protein
VLLIRQAEVIPAPPAHQPHEEPSRVRCPDPQSAARGGEHPLPVAFAGAHETVSVRLCEERVESLRAAQVFGDDVPDCRRRKCPWPSASPSPAERTEFLVFESP